MDPQSENGSPRFCLVWFAKAWGVQIRTPPLYGRREENEAENKAGRDPEGQSNGGQHRDLSFPEGVGQAGPYNGGGNSHLWKVLGQRANLLGIGGNGGELGRNSLKSSIVLLCPKADIANCEVVEHSQTA